MNVFKEKTLNIFPLLIRIIETKHSFVWFYCRIENEGFFDLGNFLICTFDLVCNLMSF